MFLDHLSFLCHEEAVQNFFAYIYVLSFLLIHRNFFYIQVITFLFISMC